MPEEIDTIIPALKALVDKTEEASLFLAQLLLEKGAVRDAYAAVLPLLPTDDERVFRLLMHAVSIDPDDVDVRLRAGEMAYAFGLYEDVVRLFSGWDAGDDKIRVRAGVLLANAMRKIGRDEEAQRIIEELRALGSVFYSTVDSLQRTILEEKLVKAKAPEERVMLLIRMGNTEAGRGVLGQISDARERKLLCARLYIAKGLYCLAVDILESMGKERGKQGDELLLEAYKKAGMWFNAYALVGSMDMVSPEEIRNVGERAYMQWVGEMPLVLRPTLKEV